MQRKYGKVDNPPAEINFSSIGIRVREPGGETRVIQTRAHVPESLLKPGNKASWDETFFGNCYNLTLSAEPFTED